MALPVLQTPHRIPRSYFLAFFVEDSRVKKLMNAEAMIRNPSPPP
jgi:hypothetical protein